MPAREWEPGRLGRAEAAALVATVALCRWLAAPAHPLYDAAFVSMRYARNLAGGAGFAFNPGESWEPVLGTDSPAWTVLLAALSRAGLDLPVAARAASVACEVLLAAAMLAALSNRRVAGTIALLSLAVLPPLARIALGGSEATLFALLALTSATSLQAGRPAASGALAALATLARPEGLLLALALAILPRALALSPRAPAREREGSARDRQGSAQTLLALGAGFVAIALPGAALLLSTFGSIVPHSIVAQVALHGVPGAAEGWRRAATILRDAFAAHPAVVPLWPLALLGLALALRTPGPVRVFTALALATAAVLLAWRPITSGWHSYVPLVAWTLWLGLGAERAAAWLSRRGSPTIARGLAHRLAPGAVPVLAAMSAAIALTLGRIHPSRVDERVHAPMQAWARDVARLHPRARVLASDVGAIGWAWGGTVLDSEGSTWPLALTWRHPDDAIDEWRPEYLLIVAEQARLRHFYEREDLRALYVPVRRFSATGETELLPRVEDASPSWVPDYVAWRRADL